jgi:uncharacterized protein YraI
MAAVRKGLSATALGAALLLVSGAPAVFAQTISVTADVHERTGPGVQYSVLRTLPQGTAVELMGCEGSWCRVSDNGREVWISARYLNQQVPTTTNSPSPQPRASTTAPATTPRSIMTDG